ncbi:MAG: hypothetical protein V4692_12320, partial [Bdellovibrionota bacterium]
MVALWVLIGLIISAVAVSVLGAGFSVLGLRDLFSSAAIAVMAMASALEFAKFVLAAYLHQRWTHVNLFMRSYLLIAIVVLSVITSMGIFGFLSNAYQSASAVLEAETLKLQALQDQQGRNANEVARINRSIDEIPVNRVTKKMEARNEAEPLLQALTKQTEQIATQIAQANLHILEVKQKVGPLIYVSKAFKIDLDDVVKYLILILVSVFDPLAICLVVATSEAMEARRKAKEQASQPSTAQGTAPVASPLAPLTVVQQGQPAQPGQPSPEVQSANPVTPSSDGEVIHMRFTDDEDR